MLIYRIIAVHELSDSERHLAKQVADDAMIMGWNVAIARHARMLGTNDLLIRQLLNKASDYNDKADPGGRIPELDDWKVEKRERSERASGFATRAGR